MIPIRNNLVNEQEGVLNEVEFSAKSENLGVIFQILRSQIYSDPVRAIVREYSTNSQDSHIAAGKPELPIQVTLPTTLDSFLKIRDFGKGLTEQEVLEIYTSYGESTKRKDANQNGLLGIGSKSGFSYSDSFMVNSYKDGILTIFNAYITPTDGSKMAMMGRGDATEPNGIEIVIPVKGNDVSKFRQKAIEQVYPYFKVLPNITNITDEEKEQLNNIRNKPALFSGTNWKFIGGNSESLVVMANVAYPIKSDTFNEDEVREEVHTMLQGGVIIEAKNGEVAFAASRETLQYDQNTKKKLASLLNGIIDELVKQGTDKFNGCRTLWNAKCMWKEVFDYGGSLYNLRHLFAKSVSFNGFKLNDNHFTTTTPQDGGISNTLYVKGNKQILRHDEHYLLAHPRNLVVINDTGIVNGIINRVVGTLHGSSYDNVYVLTFKAGSTPAFDTKEKVMAEWIKSIGFDGPTISLSSLPKEPISKYYPSLNTGGTGYKNVKHSCREFVLNNNVSKNKYANPSSFWDSVEVELEEDAGVYVELERFNPLTKMGGLTPNYNFLEFLDDLKEISIPLPPVIYGFKRSSAQLAAKNPNMKNFWDWVDEQTKDYLTLHPAIHQQLANRRYLRDLVELQPNLEILYKDVIKWKNINNHPILSSFISKLTKIGTYDSILLNKINNIIPNIETKVTLKAQYEITADLKALQTKYPIIFLMIQDFGSYLFRNPIWEKPLTEYVTLMDMVSPADFGISDGQP
jgi:hypothetical protein